MPQVVQESCTHNEGKTHVGLVRNLFLIKISKRSNFDDEVYIQKSFDKTFYEIKMTFCYMLMSTMGLVNVILNLHQPENI